MWLIEWGGELRTLQTVAANLFCHLGILDNSPMIYGTYDMTILYQGLMDGQLVILCAMEELNNFLPKLIWTKSTSFSPPAHKSQMEKREKSKRKCSAHFFMTFFILILPFLRLLKIKFDSFGCV